MMVAEARAQDLNWNSRQLVLRALRKGHDMRVRECSTAVLAALRQPRKTGAGSAERSQRLEPLSSLFLLLGKANVTNKMEVSSPTSKLTSEFHWQKPPKSHWNRNLENVVCQDPVAEGYSVKKPAPWQRGQFRWKATVMVFMRLSGRNRKKHPFISFKPLPSH